MRIRAKYLLSVFVLFLAAVVMMPMYARAEGAFPEKLQCGDNVYATLVNGTLTLTGTGATYDYDMAQTEGKEMPPFREYRSLVKKIVITDGVTSLGDQLFVGDYWDGLYAEVVLPNTLRRIGKQTFYNNKALKSITFPASLERIEDYAFVGCNYLASAKLNRGLKYLGKSVFGDTRIPYELVIPWGCTAEGQPDQALVYETLVTLNPNGGSLSETQVFRYYKKTYGQLPVPVKSGYGFLGWVVSGDAEQTVVTETTEVGWEPTLIAKWCDHPKTEIRNAQEPSYTTEGYTGDTYCKICGMKLGSGKPIQKLVLKVPAVKKVKAEQEALTVSVRNLDAAATGFIIQCSTDKNFKKNIKSKTVLRSEGSGTVKKLSAGKKYYVRVRAYKALAGRTVYSEWSKSGNSTPKLKAEKPVINKLTGVSGGFTLDLKKLGSKMTGYEVQYSTNDSFRGAKKITVPRETTHVQVYDLKPRKKYYVRVRSFIKTSKETLYSDWCRTKGVTTKKW